MNKTIYKITLLTFVSLCALPSFIHAREEKTVQASAVTVLTTKSSQTYIDNYYASVNLSSTGNTLKSSLESLLKSERKSSLSYSSLQSTAFPYTDVDPARPTGGYIVSFYSGTPVKGYSGMNKEHTWPNSHGGGKIENDPHMVRPTLTSENSARGNMYYSDGTTPGWDPDSFGNEKYRGIAARIIFYGATIGSSAGLIIEDVGRGQGSGTGNRMGKLGDLLKWNLAYPVDQSEIIRNETLDISLNYNRNPFIDDPLLACKIWGGTNTNTQQICAQAAVKPTSLALSSPDTTLEISQTLLLSVTPTPANADKSVNWSSTNPTVASVSNGLVTALSAGTTTITATSKVDSAIKVSMIITVNEAPASEPPSEEPSSEAPSSELPSSELPSSEEQPSSEPPSSTSEDDKPRSGCRGSIAGTSVLFSVITVIGIGFNLLRRKKSV